MRIRKNLCRASLIVAMFAGLQACTEVDLCYVDQHPHRTLLDFCFHWGEDFVDDKTDSMKVVAIRPVNFLRYEFRVSSGDKDNHGVLLSPEEERAAEHSAGDGDTVGPQVANDMLWVRPGNYKFICYTQDFDMMGDAFMGSEGEGGDSINPDFSDVVFHYKPFKATDPEIEQVFGAWKSHNTYSDYISGKVRPIYFAHVDYVDIPVVSGTGQKVRVDFHPEPITQHVTFNFAVEKEAGIVVDSITAEISGVPAALDLATGLVHAEKTYKMLFRVNYPALGTRQDSASAARLACTGEVDVTGIIRGVNGNMQTGPGILSLAVYTHVTEDATGQMPARTYQKIFYAGINLYNTLTENKLLEWEEDEEKYSHTCQEAVLEIGDVLTLDKDKVVEGGSSSTGLDKWFDGGDIDLDI